MIRLPERCPRKRVDCTPLSQLISEGEESFICCGEHTKELCTEPQDIFRVCWENEEVHEMGHWDERDILDTLSVLSQALSIKANSKL